jgi:hypothetical protein
MRLSKPCHTSACRYCKTQPNKQCKAAPCDAHALPLETDALPRAGPTVGGRATRRFVIRGEELTDEIGRDRQLTGLKRGRRTGLVDRLRPAFAQQQRPKYRSDLVQVPWSEPIKPYPIDTTRPRCLQHPNAHCARNGTYVRHLGNVDTNKPQFETLWRSLNCGWVNARDVRSRAGV